MDENKLLSILATKSSRERAETITLRQQAYTVIESSPQSNLDTLQNVCFVLLSQIIMPLFKTTKHPELTPTGRRNLVAPPPPSIANRFLNDPLEDEELAQPWKTPFTVPLLEYVLGSHMLLPSDPPLSNIRKAAIEAHFHLLVPAILNMIDDAAPTPWKSSGCHLLSLMCEVLASVQSQILKRRGLADVFVDALKTNFMILPTLTPEDESLELLQQLYPAFLGVVDSRFIKLMSVQKGVWAGEDPGPVMEWVKDEEFMAYQKMLTLVYRHGVMASLSHLSASSDSLSNTSSVALSTYLLKQIPEVFSRMGVHSVRHFRKLLPMLRVGLADPFLLAAPDMVLGVLDVLKCVIQVGEVRVREKWSMEILRGLVLCWLNCADDKEDYGTHSGGKGEQRKKDMENDRLQKIEMRLKVMVKELGEVVDKEEWNAIVKTLVGSEDDVRELFEG